MAITDRTRKMLWGRSGNRCAICRRELIKESHEIGNEAIIGEECHIVAREINGSRGNSHLSMNERDEYSNLILLCRNHHKEIDGQPNTFTVEALEKIKIIHETWVRDKLTTPKQASPKMFFAFRVDTGTQLCDTVMGTHAFQFTNDPLQTREEAEFIGDFAQMIHDYGDVWSEIETKDRIIAQFDFGDWIQELDNAGFLVYCVERKERWRSPDIEKPFDFVTGYTLVISKNNPIVQRKDEEVETLMGLDKQNRNDFTNFIPVVRDVSSIRFI